MSPGTVSVQVSHNFETGHRLPFLGGKCENLHGHSWNVLITFTAYQHPTGMNEYGISLEYGLLKKLVRRWIDTYLDHGCMLGLDDPLTPTLLEAGSKLFVFGADGDSELDSFPNQLQDAFYSELPWPTVEATARMLAERLQKAIDEAFGDILWIEAVNLTETATNSCVWIPNGTNSDRFARFDERLYATPTQAAIASTFAEGEIKRAGE